ncbi:guanosine polyphosphate pyrophosphohydrolase [Chryseobacterium sp. Leaf405]|uniref:HD domain-containing protein n=1 Tax=Chryseobacterium sp. Leaf405 TaxID=1736367 RepID=UPI00070198F4|nr:HD domain-containing protein [Chryseobacterium sp. Leaf405]KQT26003.1 guanosine polyphosphate pyrophosphohydrolase [Chryseobacterium sp. Leaf405]
MNIQTIYQETIKLATQKHTDRNQTIPGTNLPYVVHLSNVTMEILIAFEKSKDFNLEFAVQVALLHDSLEDTDTTFQELENIFGKSVAEGVLALTKNSSLEKSHQMTDSLFRIKQQPKEVWAVKLADRITNLQTPPPDWSEEKIKKYKTEAQLILHELKGGNDYLEQRLQQKIETYGR